MYGYVYIPKEDKCSVEKIGLLSVREQVKLKLIRFKTLQVKYGEQFRTALERYPDLRKRIGKVKYFTMDDFLTYLDWREEVTERGSNAIYLLYKPIPQKYIGAISDFSERIMYKVKVPSKWTRIHIGNPKPKSQRAWDQVYENTISSDNPLWFQYVPHFMVVPPIGTPGVLYVN